MTDAFEQPDYDPSIEPDNSKPWLNLIEDAEKAFQTYQDKSDAIDRRFADLAKLASATANDREFQLFWANIQVLAPSTYSRPPVPVVTTRFGNRKPVLQVASELLERSTAVSFDITDIDGCMLLARDALTRLSRGVLWVIYEDKQKKGKKKEKACVEYVNRRDFVHDPARNWSEVQWVAKRAWMTPDEMKERFQKTSGDAWQDASFQQRKRENEDRGNRDPLRKAGVWEIWHKGEDKVVWVVPGVDKVLDKGDPHLDLEGFFPCPKPAYGTVQPDSLIPVPDYVFYKDQLSEINDLTARIAALSDALKVKGFYAAGGEIGEAVEAAIKRADDNAILVPVANWAAFGSGGDPIIWLPTDMVAKVIVQLVELRKQLIDDVYQITGLSDIMRGLSDANETLGAQELKTQYGSVRIRDKQAELVRIARDVCRIVAEIMAENFSQQTLLDMSQMELPTDADIKRQISDLEKQGKQIVAQSKKQIEEAAQNPQIAAQVQQNPEQAQQVAQQIQQQTQEQLQQLQAQVQKLGETVTIDQVMKVLRDQRLRPFQLDIETDSTIQPDEAAQKQRANEFITAVGGYMSQAFPVVQMMPQAAPVVGAFLKFLSTQYRAGRELNTTIDEFADNLAQFASQPKPNPEADQAQQQQALETMKMQADQKRSEAELAIKQQELQMKAQIEEAKLQADVGMKQIELQRTQVEHEALLRKIEAEMARDQRKADLEDRQHMLDMQAQQQKHAMDMQSAGIKAATDVQAAEIAREQAENAASQDAAE